MIVLDANILLYAHNSSAPQHPAIQQWLASLIEAGETISLPWTTIWAFLRLSTSSRVWPNPLDAQTAAGLIREWLSQPGVMVLAPGPRHLDLLERLVDVYRATGPLVSDAVLAALAIENGATVASTDQDFRRFPELRWVNPLT